MKALVTGGTGFVGSAVVRKLLAGGQNVRVLVRPTSDCSNLEGLATERATGDLTDRGSLDSALKGCATLFHVAADYRLWTPKPQQLYEANVAGTRNLMLAALESEVDRIVYTSSVATLGRHADGLPADEKTPVTLDDMIGHYKRSKFLAEVEVTALAEKQGLPVVIVNPSTPIGPRDIKPTPTGRMIRDAALGRIPAFVDTGLNIVHVDDVATGHLLALEQGTIGERYILGGTDMSLRQILAEIARITDRKPPRIRLPHNLVLPIAYLTEIWFRLGGGGEPLLTVDGVRMAKKRMYFSSEKAIKTLGYRPRAATEAIRDAVTWFQNLD